MLKTIKKGFGLIIGALLGYGVMQVIAGMVMTKVANNDDVMERMKTFNPVVWKKMLKYRTNIEV